MNTYQPLHTTLHLNSTKSPTLGGSTETEIHNTFGPEVTLVDYLESISVSAELMEIVSIIL